MDIEKNIIQEKRELKKENEDLRELARAQRDKLNNIYEASAKAQYEAKLWEYRYKSIENWVQCQLKMTPASIQYDSMRLTLIKFKKFDLHELY